MNTPPQSHEARARWHESPKIPQARDLWTLSSVSGSSLDANCWYFPQNINGISSEEAREEQPSEPESDEGEKTAEAKDKKKEEPNGEATAEEESVLIPVFEWLSSGLFFALDSRNDSSAK